MSNGSLILITAINLLSMLTAIGVLVVMFLKRRHKLAKCDAEIYENGVCIGVLAQLPSEIIEQIVQRMAKDSGQPIDWHWFGGRARVLTTGDVVEARAHLPIVMRTDIAECIRAQRGE